MWTWLETFNVSGVPRQKHGITTIGIDGKMTQKMGVIFRILPDNIRRTTIAIEG